MPETATDLPSPRASATPWFGSQALIIIAVQVVFGFGWSLYLLVPKFLTTVLHAGPEDIGRISAVAGLAAVLTVPFAAGGLDRLGRAPFFRLGAALIVLLSLGYLQVRELSAFVYVLQGCVAAAFVLAFNATAALLADSTPPEKHGQAIGWLGGANVAMNAVATAVAEPLAERFGWHAVFELGVVAGALAFVLSFALRERPHRASGPLDPDTPSAGKPGLAGILVASVLVGGAFSAVFQFVQPYALSLGAREVRGFFLGFTASAVACRLLLGSLGDRLGRRRVTAASMLGYAACALVMVSLDPEWLVGYGFAFGAAHGLLYPTMSALVLEVVSPARRGFGLVLFNGAFNVGTAFGGFAWGMLAQRQGYPAMYVAAGSTALLATWVLALGRRKARRPGPTAST
jgi:predicted MFS family arabinose efflux permease